MGSRVRQGFDEFAHDLRFAVRQLRQAPGFAALVLTTLAVGIGANVTMAGAIDRLLLRAPPGIDEPERVVRLLLVGTGPDGSTFASNNQNYPIYQDLRAGRSFELVSGYINARFSLGVGPDAITVRATAATPEFFEVFGVRPAVGHFFSPTDGYPEGEVSGGAPLAVLSDGFWQRQYAGDSAVVGRSIRVGQNVYTVAGVAPPGFRGAEDVAPDLWLPVHVAGLDLPRYWTANRGARWLSLVGRLRAGVSRDAASEEATQLWRRAEALSADPDTTSRFVASSVIRGRGADAPREVRVTLWLGGVSSLVLLIACANVANLLLGRAFARRREIAVRLALGACGGRLARQLLAESLLVAGLGGIGALGFAVAAGRVMPRLFVLNVGEAGWVDARLFLVTAVVALGTAVLVGLAPLLQARALDLTTALRTGAASTGGRTSRVRAALVSVQAGLCLLLLIGAGLFGLSLGRVQSLDLGVDPEHTWQVRFDMNHALLPVRDVYEARSAEMLQRVAAVPGVERAARELSFGAVAPFSDATRGQSWWDRSERAAFLVAVDSGYFRALGTQSLRGRDIDAQDGRGAPRVAVITAPLATILFGAQEPLGQCLYYQMHGDQRGDCVRVVGVVGASLGRDLLDRGNPGVYIPLAQRGNLFPRPALMNVRITGRPATVLPEIRRAIQAAHPELPAVGFTRVSEWIDPQLRPWRLAAVLFAVFGGVALVIAVVGLYGVVAFTANQRSSEVAVRIALGARPKHVLRVVAGDALQAVGAGLAVAVLVALALRGAIGPLLYQTSPTDARIIATMVLTLLGAAAVASLLPVLRAQRSNPARVLRVD
ncbi:MAG TPA: ADOP family duplicated permease [Gemmatimonadaceae bacterium]